MGIGHLHERVWARYAVAWFPALLPAALWTAFSVHRADIVAALVFFGLLSSVVSGMVRESGRHVPGVVAPCASVWTTSLLGPLFDEPLPTLMVAAAMVVTTPPVVELLGRRRRVDRGVELLSDRQLETSWSDSEAELRRTDVPPDQALAVVLRREQLLDELLRRRRTPDA